MPSFHSTKLMTMTPPRLLPQCRISSLSDLAQPFCYFHMLFLTYGSQIVFRYLEPGPLGKREMVVFNASAWAMIWCYWRTCHVDPGRKGWVERVGMEKEKDMEKEREREREMEREKGGDEGLERIEWENVRWCKKCDAVKPPRAHHCKKCKRYVSPLIV